MSFFALLPTRSLTEPSSRPSRRQDPQDRPQDSKVSAIASVVLLTFAPTGALPPLFLHYPHRAAAPPAPLCLTLIDSFGAPSHGNPEAILCFWTLYYRRPWRLRRFGCLLRRPRLLLLLGTLVPLDLGLGLDFDLVGLVFGYYALKFLAQMLCSLVELHSNGSLLADPKFKSSIPHFVRCTTHMGQTSCGPGRSEGTS